MIISTPAPDNSKIFFKLINTMNAINYTIDGDPIQGPDFDKVVHHGMVSSPDGDFFESVPDSIMLRKLPTGEVNDRIERAMWMRR